ncbi:transglycosylase SLT domain-containing protein [Virgisporangium aurantiacum]|uniref:Transglycosylase SLT domain-containing protein n=1 Tax=Virgisporangium aurantiacum TaxID=175570 RepID=A0A8J3YZN5_9ACTN|nr:transglycosylase SLT domain-containing protein [Virgisporangium aurantiacum]GIJ53527.1 hypothetical protein Vau01_010430 [Virgisporangium aurantiacum]
MIRLWNRAGLYRSLGALVLVGGVAGGVAVAADGPARQPASANNAANSRPLNVADLERQDAERAEAERAARDTAQRKADEAAVAAAEQAKKSPSASASGSKSPTGKPGVTAPPAPASCNVYSGNRKTGCSMTLAAGYDLQQVGCLEKLWTKESQWNEKARNPSSGAYGIAQALPPGKMASAGGDYMTNPATQIKWGLGYIKDRYGSPCSAWNHSQNTGWY